MSAAEVAARLVAARTSGDSDQLAEVLIEHAAAQLDQGDLAGSLRALDEAGAIHATAGRTHAQAKCLHLSATVCRLRADLDAALDRARRAERLADPATPGLVAAIMEQGEVAVMRGQHGVAADHYARALTVGRAAGLLPDYEARLLRKQGTMLAAAGRFAAAAAAIGQGRDLHTGAGTHDEARRAAVELAVVHEQAGEVDRVIALIELARAEAAAAADHHVAADIELLASGRAMASGDPSAALACAQRARQHALDATAPLSYVSAAVTIADVADALGDRATAYEALASGWVTAGDVVGADAAKQLFEPRLEALREAWGIQAFLAVRDAYNERRRAALLART